jgi:hypothetical protein
MSDLVERANVTGRTTVSRTGGAVSDLVERANVTGRTTVSRTVVR